MNLTSAVTLSFQNGPIGFSARSGQLVHFWGLSGVGKSTLLSRIWGSREIKNGWLCIGIEGQELELSAFSPAQLAWARPQLMAYLPQTPHIPPNICMEHWFVEMDADLRDEALCTIGLSADLLKHRASELSGGELRRFCLLRVLLSKAPIILLDEPFTGLDPSRQSSAFQLLHKIRKSGRLLITTGHEPTSSATKSLELSPCSERNFPNQLATYERAKNP